MSNHEFGPGSVGLVETKQLTFAAPPNELKLECGRKLGPITVAYETYGKLSSAKDNAILVMTALSGDAHAAGWHEGDDKPGWWDVMIGPGKALDTNKYFVICTNQLGGCMGTTGPSSVNPETGKPWGLTFPLVTVKDMLAVKKALLDHLGVKILLAATGGSLGGMKVLEWMVSYPDTLRLAIPIATTSRLSAQAIGFNEVGRQAIMADPAWKGGDYYGGEEPHQGLAIARMIGHITYLSEASMHQKFGRRLQEGKEYGYGVVPEFEVENYLRYKGDAFVKRFDANSYIYITKAIDYFDLGRGRGSLERAFAGVKSRVLAVSFSSDWLFPSDQMRELVSALKKNNADVVYTEIQTDYGHDAFLLESVALTSLVRNFLDNPANGTPRHNVKVSGSGSAIGSATTQGSMTVIHGARSAGTAAGDRGSVDISALSPEDRVIIDFVEEGSRVLDLGCGEGDLLKALTDTKGVRAEGIELDEACIQKCVSKGLQNVHHGDLDEGLSGYSDGTIDYVILTNTIQVLRKPFQLIREMARVGRKCVVAFPNFGYWRVRAQLAFGGRMPKTGRLPHDWYESPNIRLLTITDFRNFCRKAGMRILREIPLRTGARGWTRRAKFLPNLRADVAVFLLEKEGQS